MSEGSQSERGPEARENEQVERKLLLLMEEFEAGKLNAFGNDVRLRQMEEIREQQENLAKLHFEVGASQDLYPPLSDEGLQVSSDNMKTLVSKLAELSESIENLHTNTYEARKRSVDRSSRDSTPGSKITEKSFKFPASNSGERFPIASSSSGHTSSFKKSSSPNNLQKSNESKTDFVRKVKGSKDIQHTEMHTNLSSKKINEKIKKSVIQNS